MASFAGLRIRVVPIYRAMVETVGATAVSSPPAELYTMLERNTVDRYGFPLFGIFDFSWQKVTKYRIEPGFYVADMNWMVNLDAWKKLPEGQRKLMQELMAKYEAIDAMNDAKNFASNDAERKRQADAGVVALRLPPAEIDRQPDWVPDSAVDVRATARLCQLSSVLCATDSFSSLVFLSIRSGRCSV